MCYKKRTNDVLSTLLPGFSDQGSEFVGPDTFFNAAPGLGQGEDQNDQHALQHATTLSAKR
jgi:hypothetical protein